VKQKSATCTEAGDYTKTCLDCKQIIESETYEALGHDYQEVSLSITKEPTCESAGKGMQTLKCSRGDTDTITNYVTIPITHSFASLNADAKCSECGRTRAEAEEQAKKANQESTKTDASGSGSSSSSLGTVMGSILMGGGLAGLLYTVYLVGRYAVDMNLF
jgi:hypothetical protein